MKLTVNERKYITGYFITIKTVIIIQINFLIIIFIVVLTNSTLFMIGNFIVCARIMFFKKIIATTSRNNVKFMECKVISNLVSNEEIEISRFLIW